MSQTKTIPANEQENVLSCFWAMLQECESKAESENSTFLKTRVVQWYAQWNAVTGDSIEPRFIVRERTHAEIQKMGQMASTVLRSVTAKVVLLKAFDIEWDRTSHGLSEVDLLSREKTLINVLERAMHEVNIPDNHRANVVGRFCTEWNRLHSEDPLLHDEPSPAIHESPRG